METGRLEAFSDGVLAIIITIMVLKMEVPEGASFEAFKPVIPVFLTYVLSFVYVGIYWNNHHHLLHAVERVNGKILWANLNLLFWLSLFPFVTAWMGENHFKIGPTVLYGTVLFLAALSFKILIHFVIKNEGKGSAVGQVYSSDNRLNISMVLYVLGIGLTFLKPFIGVAMYLLIAIIWIRPDERIERTLQE